MTKTTAIDDDEDEDDDEDNRGYNAECTDQLLTTTKDRKDDDQDKDPDVSLGQDPCHVSLATMTPSS